MLLSGKKMFSRTAIPPILIAGIAFVLILAAFQHTQQLKALAATPNPEQNSAVNEFGENFTVIGSFEDNENWAGGSKSYTLKRHLNQALTLTSGNGVDNMTTRIFSTPLELTSFESNGALSDEGDYIDLWGYQHDLNLQAGSIHFDASPPGKEWTDYFSYYSLGENKIGWRYLHIKKSDFSKTGNPSWGNIKRARISIRSQPGTKSVYTFDLWRQVSADTSFELRTPEQGVNIRCQSGISAQDTISRAKSIGAEIVRLPLYWHQIEISPGVFQYSQCDEELIKAADAAGLNVLAIIYGTPNWASKTSCSGRHNCPPKNPESIEGFISDVVKRFPSINFWEIWNEPNSPGFWIDENAEEYVPLLKTAYAQIKKISQDTVVLGGIYDDGEMPIDWMDKFYAAGGGDYADIIAFHPYTSQKNPNSTTVMSPWDYRGHIRAMRAIMAVYGDTVQNKNLWTTEFGFTTGGVGPVSETQQGQWNVDAYNAAGAGNLVQGFFIYELIDQQDEKEQSRSHEGNFGLYKNSSLVPKASAQLVADQYSGNVIFVSQPKPEPAPTQNMKKKVDIIAILLILLVIPAGFLSIKLLGRPTRY